MPGAVERDRAIAIKRLKVLLPLLFVLGFMFFAGITVFPLAGMPALPLQPFGPNGSPLLWVAVACASGGLFSLFGALVVAVSASSEENA
jgi:Na+/proline symporter